MLIPDIEDTFIHFGVYLCNESQEFGSAQCLLMHSWLEIKVEVLFIGDVYNV